MKPLLNALVTALILISFQAVAQEGITKYIPSAKPERIVLNITGDQGTTMAVTSENGYHSKRECGKDFPQHIWCAQG